MNPERGGQEGRRIYSKEGDRIARDAVKVILAADYFKGSEWPEDAASRLLQDLRNAEIKISPEQEESIRAIIADKPAFDHLWVGVSRLLAEGKTEASE